MTPLNQTQIEQIAERCGAQITMQRNRYGDTIVTFQRTQLAAFVREIQRQAQPPQQPKPGDHIDHF